MTEGGGGVGEGEAEEEGLPEGADVRPGQVGGDDEGRAQQGQAPGSHHRPLHEARPQPAPVHAHHCHHCQQKGTFQSPSNSPATEPTSSRERDHTK